MSRAFCPGWSHQPGQKGHFVPVGTSNRDKRPLSSPLAWLTIGPGTKATYFPGPKSNRDKWPGTKAYSVVVPEHGPKCGLCHIARRAENLGTLVFVLQPAQKWHGPSPSSSDQLCFHLQPSPEVAPPPPQVKKYSALTQCKQQTSEHFLTMIEAKFKGMIETKNWKQMSGLRLLCWMLLTFICEFGRKGS